MSDDRCPDCGTPLETFEIGTYGGPNETITVRTCCAPPPSAAELAAKADEMWLARQRRLAEGQ